MPSDPRGKPVAEYAFDATPEEPNDWGNIMVYSLDDKECFQVSRKRKDIGDPHATYKAARAAMKALPEQ